MTRTHGRGDCHRKVFMIPLSGWVASIVGAGALAISHEPKAFNQGEGLEFGHRSHPGSKSANSPEDLPGKVQAGAGLRLIA